MPSWVQDEDKWEKAKEIVKKEYDLNENDGDKFWELVTGVYKRMKGKIKKKSDLFRSRLKRVIEAEIIDIRKVFDSWEDFEEELRSGTMFDPFEEYYVPIDFKNYRIAIEGWYPDCLESINLCITNKQNVQEHYLELMEKQFGFKADKHNYIFDSHLSEFGVSYIAKEVDI